MQKANHIKLKPTAKPLSNSTERKSTPTEQIGSRMTSPTLVEFRNQNSQIPEWRLQLQNAVQQRLKAEKSKPEGPSAATQPAPEAHPAVSASAPANEPAPGNPYLSNALKRIESSRNRYYVPEAPPKKRPKIDEEPKKDFPFTIAARTETPEKAPEPESPEKAKPKLVKRKKSLPIKDLYDTSELDPKFPPARLSSSFGAAPAREEALPAPEKKAKIAEPEPEKIEPRVKVRESEAQEIASRPEAEMAVSETLTETPSAVDDYDDYASIGLRFNAGVFDFLIGSFMSFVLLLPFIVAGGNWFTFNGAIAFFATCSIVMFIYLTASVGLAGKSFGMHLFSLEMIDSGGENYPSFHQSAVSAAVYLVSTACLGIGFVTALFDEDRRAAHDLVSGTLVVREL